VDKKQFGCWFDQEKLQVLEKEGRNIDNAMKMYLAELYTLDHNIGRLIQSLKEQNLEQNTIIIFSSDQGPAPVYTHNKESIDMKENRLNMLGYAGGLRGGKHSLYEGGVRVPFIVKWPEKIPNNCIDNNSVISGLDFLPTICSIVEIEYEKDSFDGEDKSNVWYGVPEKRKTPLYWKRHKGTAISILDNQWKMYKEVGGRVALYNVEEDPFEEKEILVENDSITQSLLRKIDNWNKVLPEAE